MNLIVLPLIAIPVLAFAYRFLGRLAVAIAEDSAQYNTEPAAGAESGVVAGLRDFGVLGTPMLLGGAAFGLRFGWAPAFLWILLAGTTLGAVGAIAQMRLRTPATLRTANTLGRLFVSAILALVWAGLAAHGAHALLTFVVLYLAADRLIPFLLARRADLAAGLILVAAIGVLFSAIGVSWPLALEGPVRLVIGPYERLTQAAPVFFYALLFVMLIQKKRAGRLVSRPAYGAVGALLLGAVTVLVFVAALVSHPPMAIPRLRHGQLAMALPWLACALPFAAALAPLGDNAVGRRTLSGTYMALLFQAGCAVAFLMDAERAFPNVTAWSGFFGHGPDLVTLLAAGVEGNQRLMASIGLGPWVSQVLLAALMLLTVAALESQQEALARETSPLGRLQPLMATALLGGLLWAAHGLSATDELFLGALLGIGAAFALILMRRDFPGFMVSLGYVLLALTDIAVIAIGWSGATHHPIRAALAVAVISIEAVAAARLWGSSSRSKDHAPRSTRHQP
ncbi:MAG: hypothetical protein ACYCVM_09060 [Acidiferrobacter sp.]